MRGFRADNLRSKRTTAKAAAVTPNAVTNATLTVTAATAGGAGNGLSIRAVAGVGLDVALAAAISGGLITITLGTDGAGAADPTKNTGTLVAAAVDALTEVACVTSGSGAGVVAPFSAQSLTGGHDVWTVPQMAKQAGLTDELVQNLENGGNCEIHEAQRLADALGETLASLGTRF